MNDSLIDVRLRALAEMDYQRDWRGFNRHAAARFSLRPRVRSALCPRFSPPPGEALWLRWVNDSWIDMRLRVLAEMYFS